MLRKIFNRSFCSRLPLVISNSGILYNNDPGLFLNNVVLENKLKISNDSNYSTVSPAQKFSETLKNEEEIIHDTVAKVSDQLAKGEEGRLFAVVHICGKQFKITAEDIIIIEGYWAPHPSDQIILEKVMLVGGMDFTLVGRPILPQGLVSVTATVIEKDLSHTKPLFYKRRRKQYMRYNFYRSQQTMLRINDISIIGKINESPAIQQYSRI